MAKVAVCVALTGSKDNPGIPKTIPDIIRAAIDCANAGAAIVHVHTRDKNGNPSLAYDYCGEIISGIRAASDVLISLSTSNYLINVSDQDRLKLMELRPDFASISLKSIVRSDGQISNSHRFVMDLLESMYRNNVIPEIEIYNKVVFNKFKKMWQTQHFREKPFIQFIVGSEGGFPKDFQNLDWILGQVSNRCYWSLAGIGKMQLPLNLIGVLNGCDVIRTGMEDNIFLTRGIRATGNTQLVERAVRLLSALQIEPMTPAETKFHFRSGNGLA